MSTNTRGIPPLSLHRIAHPIWLSESVSPDTYVNIMGQYHPAHEVGKPAADGGRMYADIDRRPQLRELRLAQQAARDAGLTFRKIARQQGISINTVQSRYRYGIARLNELLTPRFKR